MTYDWLAALAFIASLVLMTMGLRWAIWRVPEFAELREQNEQADKPKMDRKAFREAVKVNNKSGLYTNIGFYILILPFAVSFDARPLWQHLLEIVGILAIFDFMYYLTHRFVFHDGPLRKVHALHHQARKPSFIDSLYVHPLETFIGLSLFLLSIPIVALIEGAPLNFFSAAVATLVFTQINTLNHTWTKLPPRNWVFRTVDYITGVHHAHHVDMNHGNYATLTMVYDKLFGTFEEPVKREAA
jgi:sterol desaturase/sphingolipid hydroxylase (fatty acid hydroxylase superfamily)